MDMPILSGAARPPAYTERQQLGLAHLAAALRTAIRHGGEITAALETCARIARRHGVEPHDAIDLVLAILPPHLARASLVGEVFRAEYRPAP
jgi:hypothetical protein